MARIEQVEPTRHDGAEMVRFLYWHDVNAYPETDHCGDGGSDQGEKELPPPTMHGSNVHGLVRCNVAGRVGSL